MWFVRHRRCQRCQLSANPGYMGGGDNSCLSTGLGVDQYLSLIWSTLHCAIYDTLKDMIQCIIHWTLRAVSMLIEFWTIHTRRWTNRYKCVGGAHPLNRKIVFTVSLFKIQNQTLKATVQILNHTFWVIFRPPPLHFNIILSYMYNVYLWEANPGITSYFSLNCLFISPGQTL